MSLLYKNAKDVTISVQIRQQDNKVELLFSADCGKHGTDEILELKTLTTKRLLEIIQDREDYTDEEYDGLKYNGTESREEREDGRQDFLDKTSF